MTDATGKKTDEAVAREVMGWRIGKMGVNAGFWVDTSGKEVAPACCPWWSPSTDIAAAFEVLEKMKTLGFSFELDWMNRLEGGRFVCEFAREGHYTREPNNQHDRGRAIADTAPHAIALAALACVRGRGGESK